MDARDIHRTDKIMAQRSRKKEKLEVGDEICFENESECIFKRGVIISFNTERVFDVRVKFSDESVHNIDVLELEKLD